MKSSIAKVLEELKLLNGKFDKLEALKAEVVVVSSGWRRKAVLGKKKKEKEEKFWKLRTTYGSMI